MATIYLDTSSLDVEQGLRVTSQYGIKRVINGKEGIHRGIDLKKGKSGTINAAVVVSPVEQTCTVEYLSTGFNYGRGTNVILKWTDSAGLVWRLRLQHLASILVPLGTTVTVGTPLGIEGWTGTTEPANVNGSHCHAELTQGGYIASWGEVVNATIYDPSEICGVKNVKGWYPAIEAGPVLEYVKIEYASIGDERLLRAAAEESQVGYEAEDYTGPVKAPEGNKLYSIVIGPMSPGDVLKIVGMCEAGELRYTTSLSKS